ncbi:MAG: choice-of-anchor P family protein, partial [Gammaproteobacteria bacterium]
MNQKTLSIRHALVACLTFAAAFLLSSGLEGARPPGGGGGGGKQPAATFSGQARVVYVNVLGGSAELVLSDTGALPSNGGALEKSLLTVNTDVAGISLDANVLHATTVGQGTESRSEASVADVDLTVSGVNIGADLLVARSAAVCDGSGNALINGSSEVLNLRVAGQSNTVSGQPNQTVSLNA